MTIPVSKLIAVLRDLVDAYEAHGDHVTKAMRQDHDALGYPASTIGDGGSRSTDGTSTTERAALNFRGPSDYERSEGARKRLHDAAVQELGNVNRWKARRDDATRDEVKVTTAHAQYCVNLWCPSGDVPLDHNARGGRCGPCRDFRRRYDRDRTAEDVRRQLEAEREQAS